MNTTTHHLLRTAAVIATLLALPAFAAANDSTSVDRATLLLARNGTVPVKSAGPYVEVGTFRIQVAVKLGQPTAKLSDGTWLYQNYYVSDSDACGTLLVRFSQDRVNELALVSSTVATAMLAPSQADDKILIAHRQ